jgi:hypothetical protein
MFQNSPILAYMFQNASLTRQAIATPHIDVKKDGQRCNILCNDGLRTWNDPVLR